MDTWEMIRTERASLADALSGLSGADWAKPSLCPGWSVRDVVGHMTATAYMTPPKFIVKMAAAGFRFAPGVVPSTTISKGVCSLRFALTYALMARTSAGRSFRCLLDLVMTFGSKPS